MKVLLTGANGFVGSHILDLLLESGLSVRVLLRVTSNTRFIEEQLPRLEVSYGSLDDEASLEQAIDGVDCIVHCAGKTKVLHISEFYLANQAGTRSLVQAANKFRRTLRHFIHISSWAVNGPTTAEAPAREDDPPAPVSEYGKSKLMGELEVRNACQVPYTVLRPSAVYGPRDTDLLFAFRAVKRRLMPLWNGGHQQVSLVYVKDVAGAVKACLERREAFGNVYNVASPEAHEIRQVLEEISRQMGVKPVRVHLPIGILYPLSLAQEFISHLTGKPNILSRQKYLELKQCGWVSATDRIRRDIGFVADTPLRAGIAQTIEWYCANGWL